MFKGSKNVEPEQHTSLVSGFGGQANAYTTEDVTVFWQTVPSQFPADRPLVEADRMATLRIDKDTFNREREVVKEERRMRVENQPYGRMSEIVTGHAFTVHPYKHATIGAMADLDAATVDEVREFYRTTTCPTTPRWRSRATSTAPRRSSSRRSTSAGFRNPRAPCRATSPPSRR